MGVAASDIKTAACLIIFAALIEVQLQQLPSWSTLRWLLCMLETGKLQVWLPETATLTLGNTVGLHLPDSQPIW